MELSDRYEGVSGLSGGVGRIDLPVSQLERLLIRAWLAGYGRAIAEAGELLGVDAAASTGERQRQTHSDISPGT